LLPPPPGPWNERCWRLRRAARSAVEHRPADIVPQPLVVKYQLADRLRELVTLPPALKSPCGLALAFWRGSTRSLDRIGGRTEFVRGDVCDCPGLASGEGGMPCCPTKVSGRAHCMAARRASLGHLDLATHPGTGMLDSLTRPWVPGLSRLEEVKDMLRTRCRPESEEMVIRINEGPAATDRHQARVPDRREDHGTPSAHIRRTPRGARATRHTPKQSLQTRWSIRKHSSVRTPDCATTSHVRSRVTSPPGRLADGHECYAYLVRQQRQCWPQR